MSEPTTIKQWLAYGDKLSVELAKVFTPKPWKHDIMGARLNTDGYAWCKKCKLWIYFECDKPKSCSVPDPITIDWNTAMEWRNKTIGDLSLQQLTVYNALYQTHFCDTKENRLIAGAWFSSYLVTPRHWFILIALMIQENAKQAAAMAAERSKE